MGDVSINGGVVAYGLGQDDTWQELPSNLSGELILQSAVAGSGANHDAQYIAVAEPTVKLPGGCYAIAVVNTIAQKVDVTIESVETVGTSQYCALTTFEVAASSNVVQLVQGWMLAAGRVKIDPQVAGTGSVTIIIRRM